MLGPFLESQLYSRVQQKGSKKLVIFLHSQLYTVSSIVVFNCFAANQHVRGSVACGMPVLYSRNAGEFSHKLSFIVGFKSTIRSKLNLEKVYLLRALQKI